MDSLNAYDSSDEEKGNEDIKASPASALMEKLKQAPLNSAPPVPIKVCSLDSNFLFLPSLGR